eukprot:3372089-Lingulodinium_polyedra.AAC.1
MPPVQTLSASNANSARKSHARLDTHSIAAMRRRYHPHISCANHHVWLTREVCGLLSARPCDNGMRV